MSPTLEGRCIGSVRGSGAKGSERRKKRVTLAEQKEEQREWQFGVYETKGTPKKWPNPVPATYTNYNRAFSRTSENCPSLECRNVGKSSSVEKREGMRRRKKRKKKKTGTLSAPFSPLLFSCMPSSVFLSVRSRLDAIYSSVSYRAHCVNISTRALSVE